MEYRGFLPKLFLQNHVNMPPIEVRVRVRVRVTVSIRVRDKIRVRVRASIRVRDKIRVRVSIRIRDKIRVRDQNHVKLPQLKIECQPTRNSGTRESPSRHSDLLRRVKIRVRV